MQSRSAACRRAGLVSLAANTSSGMPARLPPRSRRLQAGGPRARNAAARGAAIRIGWAAGSSHRARKELSNHVQGTTATCFVRNWHARHGGRAVPDRATGSPECSSCAEPGATSAGRHASRQRLNRHACPLARHRREAVASAAPPTESAAAEQQAASPCSCRWDIAASGPLDTCRKRATQPTNRRPIRIRNGRCREWLVKPLMVAEPSPCMPRPPCRGRRTATTTLIVPSPAPGVQEMVCAGLPAFFRCITGHSPGQPGAPLGPAACGT